MTLVIASFYAGLVIGGIVCLLSLAIVASVPESEI